LPERLETLADAFGRCPASGCARTHDDVGGGQAMLGVTKRFADYATKSVTRVATVVVAYGERKTGITETAALPIRRFKIDLAQDPVRCRKPETAVLGLG
jgi:hypothetical protein